MAKPNRQADEYNITQLSGHVVQNPAIHDPPAPGKMRATFRIIQRACYEAPTGGPLTLGGQDSAWVGPELAVYYVGKEGSLDGLKEGDWVVVVGKLLENRAEGELVLASGLVRRRCWPSSWSGGCPWT